MLEKNIIFILLFIISFNLKANVHNQMRKLELSKLAVGARVGGSISNSELRSGQTHKEKEFLVDLSLNTRYALSPKFAINGGGSKWLNTGELSSSSGNLATSFNLGVDWALSGTLISQELKNLKTNKSMLNKTDGWRIGANLSQMNFSKIEKEVYSIGANTYYESRLGTTKHHIQYGIKFDSINDSKIKANLIQVYVGFMTFP